MAKTGCAGSAIDVAPICLNFGITAPVLSCVITWRGRIETKSPARTTAPGASPIRVSGGNLLDEREAHISFHLNKAAGVMSSRLALACEKLFKLNHSAIKKCNLVLRGA